MAEVNVTVFTTGGKEFRSQKKTVDESDIVDWQNLLHKINSAETFEIDTNEGKVYFNINNIVAVRLNIDKELRDIRDDIRSKRYIRR